MATIGKPLLAPEVGWKRIDETDVNFIYNGNWTNYTVDIGQYNGSMKITGDFNATVKFQFYGTSLRILGRITGSREKNAIIEIDNVKYNYSQDTTSFNGFVSSQALLFEKKNLNLGVHTVIIKKGTDDANIFLDLDAIDIDENGYIAESKIGKPLLEPESGWKRIDHLKNSSIKFTGNWIYGGADIPHAYTIGDKAIVTFKSDKIRLITDGANDNRATNGIVKIDGVEYTINPKGNGSENILCFELLGLTNTEHVFEYDHTQANLFTLFMGLDLDENGYLSVYSANKILIKQNNKYYKLDGTEITDVVDSTTIESIFKSKGDSSFGALTKLVSDNLLKNGNYEILYYKSK